MCRNHGEALQQHLELLQACLEDVLVTHLGGKQRGAAFSIEDITAILENRASPELRHAIGRRLSSLGSRAASDTPHEKQRDWPGGVALAALRGKHLDQLASQLEEEKANLVALQIQYSELNHAHTMEVGAWWFIPYRCVSCAQHGFDAM